jgi:hypothetical protein
MDPKAGADVHAPSFPTGRDHLPMQTPAANSIQLQSYAEYPIRSSPDLHELTALRQKGLSASDVASWATGIKNRLAEAEDGQKNLANDLDVAAKKHTDLLAEKATVDESLKSEEQS